MKIAVFSKNLSNMYSGGRYASLILALSLAHRGHDVYYISNNKPIFLDDFKDYETRLTFVHVPNYFQDIPETIKGVDIVVLVPHPSKPSDTFFPIVRNFASKNKARLVLLNFESGNWVKECSPFPKDLSSWDNWRNACEEGCLILSISKEGKNYSEKFYVDYPDRTHFEYWYPSVNSKVADSIPEQTKSNSILIISRLSDKHKGATDILKIIGKQLKNMHVVIMLGTKNILPDQKAIVKSLKTNAKRSQVKLEFKYQLNDYQKFLEIKKASVMVFPSYFEGYGYPPVEALYCNTPCVAYNLPVLRETCGNALTLVERGDTQAMGRAIVEVLDTKNDKFYLLRDQVYDFANFNINGERLENLFKEYLRTSKVYAKQEPPSWVLEPEEFHAVTPTEWVSKLDNPVVNFLWKWGKPVLIALGIRKLYQLIGYGCVMNGKSLGGISKCHFDSHYRTLKIYGWSLGAEIDEIRCYLGEEFYLGNAELNQPRKDVFQKYPNYNNPNSGWQLIKNLKPLLIEEEAEVRVEIMADKKLLKKFKTKIKNDDRIEQRLSQLRTEGYLFTDKESITCDSQAIYEELQSNKLPIEEFMVDFQGYTNWMKEIDYENSFPEYTEKFPQGIYLSKKSFQHYLSIVLLEMEKNHDYVDVASSASVFPDILIESKLASKVYRQDINFQKGIHGEIIGSDASEIPLPKNSIDRMGLHCSWEHFEGDSDVGFIQEAGRILKTGGKVCIIPLYMANDFVLYTSPSAWFTKYRMVPDSPVFDKNAKIIIDDKIQQRQSKYYSPSMFKEKIYDPFKLIFDIKIYYFKNNKEVNGCPLFGAVFTKK